MGGFGGRLSHHLDHAGLKEMIGLAERQASLETVNATIEQQVDLRTGELELSRTEALHNLEEAQQARGKAEAAEQELLEAKKTAEGTEARLRRSEAMFRQLFDAVPDLVTVSRLSDGKFIEVNAEFLRRTGLSREKALTTSTLETGQWARPEERKLFVQKLRADGHVREFEVDFRLQGAVVPYLASSVVVEVDGETCTLGVGHDITRIKEGERALHEAQQRLSAQVEELTSTQRELIAAREAAMDASHAKSEFLSSMSHEIRTPMNAILGMAELLEDTPLNRDQKKYLSIISNNGDALLALINDILDLAKVEAGRAGLEQINFDLENLTDKVVETLSLRAHSKGLELAVHMMPDVPRQLGGDPLRLRQVLINLIGNAIKFTESGQVLLTLERDGAASDPGAILFTVSDTGIGIAADKLDAVFSNFVQADSSTTRRYGGSGLGLAIAKRLVDLMKGRIWVESKRRGQRVSLHRCASRLATRSAPQSRQRWP
jgi:PAS domain S-box-containing protein